jgi:hypothetical protein
MKAQKLVPTNFNQSNQIFHVIASERSERSNLQP